MWRPLEQRSNIYIADVQMYSPKSTRLSRAKSPARLVTNCVTSWTPENLLGDGSGIETFRVLRDREKRQFGEYRTQRLELEAWDRFELDGTFQAAPQRAEVNEPRDHAKRI
jgi:hypothetical protein